ncbi:MAG: class I SAM-dependent methyltransferase [Actinomycetes bacterium]
MGGSPPTSSATTTTSWTASSTRPASSATSPTRSCAGPAPGRAWPCSTSAGTGDVSFLAARLVGPTGTVLGVDRSAEAVAVAERRARDAGLGDVAFAVQEVAELTVTAQVDALVGRLVLMYLDDPAAVLRRLLEAVRPGGAVAFQEMDMGAVACEPDCPLVTASGDRIRQTFALAGLDDRTGLKLARIYRDAGLPAPETLQGARVASGPDSPVYAYVARPPVPCCPSWSAPAWPPPPRSTPRPPGCGSRSWPPTPPSSRRPSSAPGPGSQPRLRHPGVGRDRRRPGPAPVGPGHAGRRLTA